MMKSVDKTAPYLDQDLFTHHDPLSKVSEAYKMARTNIEFAMIDENLKTLNVTSTQQGEGKTITIANLAISYAQAGRKILLIDADLRRPSVHRRFGLSNRNGLTNAIVHGDQPELYIQDSRVPNLYIMTSGPIPPNPAEMLMSKTMWRLIEELKPQFDQIFIDGAPVGIVTDSAIISSRVDGTIFVVRAGAINKTQLRHATELLKKVNAKVLGFILNGTNKQTDDYYQYYYYQDSYGQESQGNKGSKKKKGKWNKQETPDGLRYRELQKSFSHAGQAIEVPTSIHAPSAQPARATDYDWVKSKNDPMQRPLSSFDYNLREIKSEDD